MDVLSYLSELIKTRKEVGIAGLGTIFKKKSPGRYDVATHSFLPPSYVLDFKTEVTETESLPAYVSQKRNLSRDSGDYFVGLFVEGLKNQLNANQEADLAELGKLLLQNGNLVFLPSKGAETGFDFYGLPSVNAELPAPKAEVAAITRPEQAPEEPVAAQVEEAVSIDEPAIELQPGTEIIEEQNELEERLDLEDANADLSDGIDKFDEQPVYEEISEPVRPVVTPPPVFIETPEGLEEPEEIALAETATDRTVEAKPFVEPERMVQSEETASAVVVSDTDAPVAVTAPGTEEKHGGTPAYVWAIVTIVFISLAVIGLYLARPELFRGKALEPVVPVQQTDTAAAAVSEVKPDTAPVVTDTPKTDIVLKDTAAVPVVVADTATTWEVIGASVLNQKEIDQVLAQLKKAGINGKVIPSHSKKRRIKISVATYPDEMSARDGRKELVIKLKDPELYIFQYKHTHK